MKKALSVFLAILMLFSALSVGSSVGALSSVTPSQYHGEPGSGMPAGYNQAVVIFYLRGGSLKEEVRIWDLDTADWKYVSNLTGEYVMVPQNSSDMINDGEHYIILPAVTAPDGRQFDGWRRINDTDSNGYAANMNYKIPSGVLTIEFEAQYSAATIEQDTMTKVLDILMRVFGTIIGLLFYSGDTEAGIALMNKVFAGVLG